MSKSETRKDYYTFQGLQRDVNPFGIKDSELSMCTNWYTHQFGAKKVRPGYTAWLNAVDASPVRNLIYYNFPNGSKGVLRVSNKKNYTYTPGAVVWTANGQTYTVDSWMGNTQLAGANGPRLHLCNGPDGYHTYDGTIFPLYTGGASPNQSKFLTAWRSRIFADVLTIRLVQSAVGFDISYADPWAQSTIDPSSAGTVAVDDAGNGGKIVAMTTCIDRVNIYRDTSVYRYNGQGIIRLPFDDLVLGGNSEVIAHYDIGGYEYFMSSKAIMKVDGRQISPASFGINSIIEDTYNTYGITNPIPFTWGFLTGFFIGQLKIGKDTIQNGMLVHDERYDEWFVWSLAHQMTCFSTIYDFTTNAQTLICGDINGNTFMWGEQYGSDAGIPINYRLRTKYFDFGSPESTKIPDRLSISTYQGSESTISIATNYNDQFKELDIATGFLRKVPIPDTYNFNSLSLEISGSTLSNRPEFYGMTLKIKDEGERYDKGTSLKQ